MEYLPGSLRIWDKIYVNSFRSHLLSLRCDADLPFNRMETFFYGAIDFPEVRRWGGEISCGNYVAMDMQWNLL